MWNACEAVEGAGLVGTACFDDDPCAVDAGHDGVFLAFGRAVCAWDWEACPCGGVACFCGAAGLFKSPYAL